MTKFILKRIKQEIYHRLRLYPIYRVIDAINSRLPLKGCSALEAFAYTGAWQARAYSSYPAYLEAWEIDPACEQELQKNLPRAVIKITDSFNEILHCRQKFDFINGDTHQGIFGPYCENFEFFPLLFGVAKSDCIVNLNVIPEAPAYWRKRYPALFNEEHLKRRKDFYGNVNPEKLSLNEMLEAYSQMAAKHNFEIVWHYYLKRSLTYYLVLHLRRRV